jgi:capsular exopolysaccharide synthesis family protein
MNALQLNSNPEFTLKKKGLNLREAEKDRLDREEKMINSFLNQVKISPDSESRLVQVSFESPNPELSAKAANTLVDKYIEWVSERRLDATKSARDFLQKQLGEVKVRLEKAEEDLSTFAKGADIVSLDKDLNLTYKQLAELNDALSKAETERLTKEALYKQAESGNYSYLPQVVSDPETHLLNQEYTKAKAEYDNLAAVFGPDYPHIKQLRAQVEGIQNQIKQRINGIAESIKKDYEAALGKENILRQTNEEQKKLVTQLNDKTVQYSILQREVDTNKSIYENLLQRLKETEVTSGIKVTNIQVVDYASPPLKPYKPNIKLNMLLATLAGLMGGIFLAFVFEHFDSTVKDEEEIKRHFPLPFLGAIPLVPGEGKSADLDKAVYLNPKSIISEAFRIIRTSIIYSTPSHPPRLLLVTSTQPSEGKTTSASNIALSMVQSGRKVVLVDADFRKPRLSKVFSNNGKSSGLSTYLVGKKRLSSVINCTDINGLDIIPSGPIPPDPAELLGSEKMKKLLKSLLKKYDYVVLDGAPIGGFADSQLLSTLVDGVLLITSVGITQRQALSTSIEEILKVKGRIVGTIVNRLESRRNKYGYNYYYYYNDEESRREKKISIGTKLEKGKRDSNKKGERPNWQTALPVMVSSLWTKIGSMRFTYLASTIKGMISRFLPWTKAHSRGLIYSASLTVIIFASIFYLAESGLPFRSAEEKREFVGKTEKMSEAKTPTHNSATFMKGSLPSGSQIKEKETTPFLPEEIKKTLTSQLEAKASEEGKSALLQSEGMSKPTGEERAVTSGEKEAETALHSFVPEYVSVYKSRNIDKFISFFEPDAVENGVAISKALSSYRKTFSALEVMKYDVQVKKTEFKNNRASIDGDFVVFFRNKNEQEIRISKGTMSWTLLWQDNRWKIKELNYKLKES